MSWSIDGIEWTVPCDILRTAEIKPSEISGLLLNKRYFNDVLGTYMAYEIGVAVPFGKEDEYTRLYEILTAPIGEHTFIMPYNQDTVTFLGRVENVKDAFVRIPGGKKYWKGLTFTAIANHPSKTMTLGDVLSIGLTPLPTSVSIPVGSVWKLTTTGWEPYTAPTYPDFDEVYF